MNKNLLIPPELENPLSNAVSNRDRTSIKMVESAVAGNDVALAYQPVVFASDPSRVAFYEGLIRVLDPTGRVIPAGEFIQAIETKLVGREVDCAALDLGLAALRKNPKLRLSINMSARSIGYERWRRKLENGISSDANLADRLILEVTESSAMVMPEIVQAFMNDFQLRGVTFALDDFGAGFTSISYLRDMYFDILKIDGQFIRGISHNPDNKALTKALVSIGRHFDMLTVAESVENAEDAAYLASAGVACLQGYHFGLPKPRPTLDH